MQGCADGTPRYWFPVCATHLLLGPIAYNLAQPMHESGLLRLARIVSPVRVPGEERNEEPTSTAGTQSRLVML